MMKANGRTMWLSAQRRDESRSGQSGKLGVKDVGTNGWSAGIVRRVAVALIRRGAADEPSSAELRRKSMGVWGVFQAGRAGRDR